MQTANVMVANGGDRGNTVPKYGVTAAEIAVLLAIHGPDAVFDIQPGEDVDRTNSVEMGRLRANYGMARDEDGVAFIDRLYPGAGARLHQNLSELELDESLFRPVERSKPKPDTTTGDPEVAGKGVQTASPGSISRTSGYEPPEVPAEEGNTLEDPRNQDQIDKAPGVAANASGGSGAGKIDAMKAQATTKAGEKKPSVLD